MNQRPNDKNLYRKDNVWDELLLKKSGTRRKDKNASQKALFTIIRDVRVSRLLLLWWLSIKK